MFHFSDIDVCHILTLLYHRFSLYTLLHCINGTSSNHLGSGSIQPNSALYLNHGDNNDDDFYDDDENYYDDDEKDDQVLLDRPILSGIRLDSTQLCASLSLSPERWCRAV